jgi:hypothetical protein
MGRGRVGYLSDLAGFGYFDHIIMRSEILYTP